MSWFGVTDFPTYLAGAVGIILLPGPNSLYVWNVASSSGLRAGYSAAVGVFAGDTVLLLMTAMGATGLLHGWPMLFGLIKWVGAAYLGWIGIHLLIQNLSGLGSKTQFSNPADDSVGSVSLKRPMRTAFLISCLNPKAILFLLSFLVQFVDPDYDKPFVTFFILGGLIQVLSMSYLSMLIHVGSRLENHAKRHPRLRAVFSSLIGGLLIGFGVKLATASLN